MQHLLDLLAGFPPYFKYLVLAFTPTIELRGAVPWAVQQGDTGYLPLILIANYVIFFPAYFFLELVYDRIPHGSWLHRKLDSAREKAHPLVEKYGLLGIALFVAVPLPGTGAYSGTAAAWLLGMDRRKALLGVVIGVTIAFLIVWAISEGVAFGFRSMTPSQ